MRDSASETALVKNTGFEKVLKRIEDESRVTNRERGKCRLLKSIFSVYHFLTVGLGMKHGNLSLEEFEAAEAELKKIAENENKKWRNRAAAILWKYPLLHYIGDRSWGYYLEYGYFPNHSCPFKSGLRVYCDQATVRFREFDEDAGAFLAHCDESDKRSSHLSAEFTPKNLQSLFESLMKARGME